MRDCVSAYHHISTAILLTPLTLLTYYLPCLPNPLNSAPVSTPHTADQADPQLGDAWAAFYKFELQHGTEAEQEDIVRRCVAAEPRYGEYWQRIAKVPSPDACPVRLSISSFCSFMVAVYVSLTHFSPERFQLAQTHEGNYAPCVPGNARPAIRQKI